MKKLLFFLFFFPILLYGQDKIDGIGKLKIGMSETQLRELFEDTEISELKSKSRFIEKVPNVDGVKGFAIREYIPAGDYRLKELELLFYNDSLFNIKTSIPSKIGEALTLKYGDPKVDKKEEVKHYVNGIGNKIEKLDQTFTSYWETNIPNIDCVEIISKYHDDKGVSNTIFIFHIFDKVIEEKVRKLNSLQKGKAKEAEKQRKLNELDDL